VRVLARRGVRPAEGDLECFHQLVHVGGHLGAQARGLGQLEGRVPIAVAALLAVAEVLAIVERDDAGGVAGADLEEHRGDRRAVGQLPAEPGRLAREEDFLDRLPAAVQDEAAVVTQPHGVRAVEIDDQLDVGVVAKAKTPRQLRRRAALLVGDNVVVKLEPAYRVREAVRPDRLQIVGVVHAARQQIGLQNDAARDLRIARTQLREQSQPVS